MKSTHVSLIMLSLFVIMGVAAYADATDTISIGEGNDSILNDNVTLVNESVTPTDNVTVPIAQPGDSGNTTQAPVIINNNNYIKVDNNIQVPTTIQPTIQPTDTASDDTLQKAEPVKEKTVKTPTVVKQKTVTIKETDLYTGQIVKMSESEEEKKGLEIVEVNTGKKGCEYIIIKNNNDFNMGLGGYTIYVDETETGMRLPNVEIAAEKSIKMFTVNGKPDTFDAEGNLVKFHFRLAKEMYPDNTPVNIYLLEPNFNEAISQMETSA